MTDQWNDRLSEYIDDELTPAERVELEDHLATCRDCTVALGELREVVERAGALTPRPPDADLWPGIAPRLERGTVHPFAAPRGTRRFSFTMPQLVAAGLALMVMSGGGVWVLQHGGRATSLPQVQAADPTLVPVALADPRYDEAIADLEQRRDLVMLEAFDVVQHEDLARAVGQLLERGLEIHPEVARLRRTGQHLENIFAVDHPAAPDLLGTEAFDHHVHGEAMQPGGERRVAAKRAELLPQPDEDILGELVGVAPGGHPADEAVHARQVRAVDGLEGNGVSRRGTCHVRHRDGLSSRGFDRGLQR